MPTRFASPPPGAAVEALSTGRPGGRDDWARPGRSVPGRARRVLVADDDGDQRLLVEIAVRRAGLDAVTSVPDGAGALATALAWCPDLVVLDVAMPGMSGLEVCAALRADARTAGTRVLLVTAAVQPAAIRAGLAAGADGYVTKPFRVRDLSDRVAALLAV